MRCSKAYKNWVRETCLNKYDINLLIRIAQNKAELKNFRLIPKRRKRLEDLKAKLKETVKKDVYPFKDILTEEESVKLNEVVVDIIDFTDAI